MTDLLGGFGSNVEHMFDFLSPLALFIISVFNSVLSIFTFLINSFITLFLALLNFVIIFISILIWIIYNPFLVIGIIEVYCIGLSVIATYKDIDNLSKPFTAIKTFLNTNKVVIIAVYDFTKWYYTMLLYSIQKIIEFIIRIVDIIVPDWL